MLQIIPLTSIEEAHTVGLTVLNWLVVNLVSSKVEHDDTYFVQLNKSSTRLWLGRKKIKPNTTATRYSSSVHLKHANALEQRFPQRDKLKGQLKWPEQGSSSSCRAELHSGLSQHQNKSSVLKERPTFALLY